MAKCEKCNGLGTRSIGRAGISVGCLECDGTGEVKDAKPETVKKARIEKGTPEYKAKQREYQMRFYEKKRAALGKPKQHRKVPVDSPDTPALVLPSAKVKDPACRDYKKKAAEMTPEEQAATRKYKREWAARKRERNQDKPQKTRKDTEKKDKLRIKNYELKQHGFLPPVRRSKERSDKMLVRTEEKNNKMTAIIIVLRGNTEDVVNQLNTLLNI